MTDNNDNETEKHKPETDIEPLVADWFREQYGDDAVETQGYQSDPRWFCDIVVDTGWARLFVEVENDADAVRPGTAQAQGYAGDDPVRGVPMVVTPKDHIDPVRAERLRRGGNCLIREFDGEAGEWVDTTGQTSEVLEAMEGARREAAASDFESTGLETPTGHGARTGGDGLLARLRRWL